MPCRSIQGVLRMDCIFKMMLLAVFSLVCLVSVSGAVNDGIFDATELIASLQTSKFYINGTWTEPIVSPSELETRTDRYIEVVDPSTATVVAKMAVAGPEDIDAAVKAAKEAWLGWSYHTSSEERQLLVQNLI